MKNKQVNKTNKMKIAVIGFGSLLFNSKGLSIGKWAENGPLLPLEFSRISRDGRLTIVIDVVNGRTNPTYFAISKHSDIDKVLKEFQKREHIKDELLNVQIGVWDIKNGLFNQGASKFPRDIVFDPIHAWAKENGVDAVVFSALARKFKQKLDIPFSNENAFTYLGTLEPQILKKATKYINETKISTNFKDYFVENQVDE
jgi:hypothetical protein